MLLLLCLNLQSSCLWTVLVGIKKLLLSLLLVKEYWFGAGYCDKFSCIFYVHACTCTCWFDQHDNTTSRTKMSKLDLWLLYILHQQTFILQFSWGGLMKLVIGGASIVFSRCSFALNSWELWVFAVASLAECYLYMLVSISGYGTGTHISEHLSDWIVLYNNSRGSLLWSESCNY